MLALGRGRWAVSQKHIMIRKSLGLRVLDSAFFSSTEFLGFKQAINQSLFLLTLAQKYITIMKIVEVEIRVLAAWNNHWVSGAR